MGGLIFTNLVKIAVTVICDTMSTSNLYPVAGGASASVNNLVFVVIRIPGFGRFA